MNTSVGLPEKVYQRALKKPRKLKEASGRGGAKGVWSFAHKSASDGAGRENR